MRDTAERERERLVALVRSSPWFVRALRAARACALPRWLLGGGVLRDLVWDSLHDGFDPALVRDVDVAFFDPSDLTPARDTAATSELRALLPGVPWEATNQAAVHLWYEAWTGVPAEPLRSTADGVATWPETATSVGIHLHADDTLEVVAPHGLTDLLAGVCRRNPRRLTADQFRERVARKQVHTRWPRVRVVPP